MKRPILILFIISLSLGLKISAQTNTTITDQQTDDFPVFQNTGNPELDAKNYEKSKANWISKNPQKYSEMNDQLNTGLPELKISTDTNLNNNSETDNSEFVPANLPSVDNYPLAAVIEEVRLYSKLVNGQYRISKKDLKSLSEFAQAGVLRYPETFKIVK